MPQNSKSNIINQYDMSSYHPELLCTSTQYESHIFCGLVPLKIQQTAAPQFDISYYKMDAFSSGI